MMDKLGADHAAEAVRLRIEAGFRETIGCRRSRRDRA